MTVEKNRPSIFKEIYVWKVSDFSSKPFEYELKSFFVCKTFFFFSIASLCMSMPRDIHSPRWELRGFKGRNTPSGTFFIFFFQFIHLQRDVAVPASSAAWLGLRKSIGVFLAAVPWDLRFCRPNPASSYTSATPPAVNGAVWRQLRT